MWHELNNWVPRNLYVDALTPTAMVLEGGVFGRWVGFNEVIGMGPLGGLVPVLVPSLSGETAQRSSSPEDPARRKPSASGEAGSHQNPTPPATRPQTASLPNC